MSFECNLCVRESDLSRMFRSCTSSSVCVYVTYRICQVEGFGSKNQCCRLLWPLLLRIGFNKRYAGTSLRVAAGAIKREKAGFFFFPISAVCLAQLRMRRSFLTQIIWMPRWHRTIKKTGCIWTGGWLLCWKGEIGTPCGRVRSVSGEISLSQLSCLQIKAPFINYIWCVCEGGVHLLIDIFIWSQLDSPITVTVTGLRDNCMLRVFMSSRFVCIQTECLCLI